MTVLSDYTPELGAVICDTRREGTRLRDAVKAAGVPWRTFCDWLKRGRAYNDAAPADRNPRHAALGAFAADIDRAGAQATAALHARVMAATVTDGRLALDVLRWNEERSTRELKRKLLAAQAEVERMRAAGLLVNRTDVTTDGRSLAAMTDDELRAHIAALAAG
jgi:hypothetical protein